MRISDSKKKSCGCKVAKLIADTGKRINSAFGRAWNDIQQTLTKEK